MKRRMILKSALAAVTSTIPLASHAGASDFEYAGEDSPAAFARYMSQNFRGTVVANVFGATWCTPCKIFSAQLRDMQKKPDIPFKTVGIDIDKYPKLWEALNVPSGQPKNTPATRFYLDGRLIPGGHVMIGYSVNVPDMERFFRDAFQTLRLSQPVIGMRP